MKKLMMIAVLMVSALAVNAQDYNWAVGVRGGWENAGITLKKGMGGTALDFTGSWDFRSEYTRLRVQGLYEWQQNLSGGLDWYYGIGAHLGLWGDEHNNGSFWAGVDAVLGLEFKFPELPIAISLDYRPGVNVLPNVGVGYGDVGFGLKFCF